MTVWIYGLQEENKEAQTDLTALLSAGNALAGLCDTTGRISVVPLDQPAP